MKKYLFVLLLLLPTAAFASQISVPSAPGAGYSLTSLSTGQYVASSTHKLLAGTGVTYSGGQPYIFGPADITISASGVGTGLSTTSPVAAGNVLEYSSTGAGSAFGVATTSLSISGPFTITNAIGVLSNGSVTYYGLATTSSLTQGQLLYNTTGGNGVASVGTSTLTASGPLTGSFTQVGSGGSLGCATAASGVAGCLNTSDWATFNNKVSSTSLSATAPLNYTPASGLFTITNASAGVTGALTGSDWSLFNNKISSSSLSAGYPLTYTSSSGAFTFAGLSTTSPWTQSSVAYVVNGNTLTSVATSSETCTSPLSCAAHAVLTGGGAITISTANSTTAGALAAADFNTFNMKVATSAAETQGQLAVWGTTNGSPAKLYSLATSSESIGGPFNIPATYGKLVGGSGSIGYYGLATTSNLTQGQLLYNTTGGSGVASVGTSTLTASSPLTGSFTQVGSGGSLGLGTVGYANGGTGSTTAPQSQLLYGGATAYQSVATTSVTCSGTVSCTTFTAIGTSPITLTGSASGSGVGTIATSSPDLINAIPYSTTASAYPAKLSYSNELQWDNTNRILSLATTTDHSATIDTGGTFNISVGGDGEPFNLNTNSGLTAGSTGGAINLQAGNGSTTAAGGAITLTSGAGSGAGANGTGAGGDLSLSPGAGGAAGGNGGNTFIQGGNGRAASTNGGNVNLQPGPAGSGGTNGQIRLFNTYSSTNYGILDVSAIASSNKTFTFPNLSGTIALGTGSTGNCAQWSNTNTLTAAAAPCGSGGSGLSTTSPVSASNLLVYSSVGAGSAYGVATSTLTASSPLTGSLTQIGSGGSIGIQSANSTQAGALTAADWLTFNNKVATSAAETAGQLAVWGTTNGTPAKLYSIATGTVSAGSSAITVTAGRSVIGGSLAIDCAAAGTSQNGCLSSTDWNTFNGKLGSYNAWTNSAGPTSATTSILYTAGLLTGSTTTGVITATSTTASSTFKTPLLLDNAPTNLSNFLNITASRVYPGSVTTGGMVHLDNGTTNTGTAFEVVTGVGSGTTGRGAFFNATNIAYDTELLFASSSAANQSTFGLIGMPSGKGIIKITHDGTTTTGYSNGSGLSIDTTADDAQGIFVKVGSGNPLTLVNSSSATLAKWDALGNATTTGLSEVDSLTANKLVYTNPSKILATTGTTTIDGGTTGLSFSNTPYVIGGSASSLSGTLVTANGGTNHGNYTAGSVVFAGTSGTSLTENNANFFWDNSLVGLGIGTTTPRWGLTIASSSAPQIALTDASLTSNPWTFRSVGGNLYFATSAPATFATSTFSAISLIPNTLSQIVVGATSSVSTLGSTNVANFLNEPGGNGTNASSTVVIGDTGTTTSVSQIQLNSANGTTFCIFVNNAGTLTTQSGKCN